MLCPTGGPRVDPHHGFRHVPRALVAKNGDTNTSNGLSEYGCRHLFVIRLFNSCALAIFGVLPVALCKSRLEFSTFIGIAMVNPVVCFASLAIAVSIGSGIVAQVTETPEFNMAEVAILDSIDGRWTLTEYNEDGQLLEGKRKLFKDLTGSKGMMTHQMDIGGRNLPTETTYRAEKVNADEGLILFRVSKPRYPDAMLWAKVEKDRILFCCISDKNENQNSVLCEFEPREGLTLLTWTRVTDDLDR